MSNYIQIQSISTELFLSLGEEDGDPAVFNVTMKPNNVDVPNKNIWTTVYPLPVKQESIIYIDFNSAINNLLLIKSRTKTINIGTNTYSLVSALTFNKAMQDNTVDNFVF